MMKVQVYRLRLGFSLIRMLLLYFEKGKREAKDTEKGRCRDVG